LVARGDRHGVCLAVIPADRRLDFKALAKVSGDRKVETVPLKEVQGLTGYIRGGVTALACKKPYPVYLHDSAAAFERIAVSAGKRGTMLMMAPADYCQALNAIYSDLVLV
jgi:Cys-tRNA(Pro)/Cys-tRNA(Cys) deacylase